MEVKLSALSIYDRPTSRQTDNGFIRKLPYNYLENPIDDNTAQILLNCPPKKTFVVTLIFKSADPSGNKRNDDF